jgi:hypothetical protein
MTSSHDVTASPLYSLCVLSWDFSHTWWRHSSVETSCWQNTIVYQQKGVALKFIFKYWRNVPVAVGHNFSCVRHKYGIPNTIRNTISNSRLSCDWLAMDFHYNFICVNLQPSKIYHFDVTQSFVGEYTLQSKCSVHDVMTRRRHDPCMVTLHTENSYICTVWVNTILYIQRLPQPLPNSSCYWPCRNPCLFDVELATQSLSLF